MDVKIAGKGGVSAGTYAKIKIKGNGKLGGLVQCENLSASGSIRGEELVCEQKMKISGKAAFSQNVQAKDACVKGVLCVDGEICAEKLEVSGAIRCGGAQAEQVKVCGAIRCKGGIAGKEIDIRFDGKTNAEYIKGEVIKISASKGVKIGKALLCVRAWKDKANAKIKEYIDGDEIKVNDVTCPRVTGKRVCIGTGCHIGVVQYSDKVEISPRAKVGKVEKVEDKKC